MRLLLASTVALFLAQGTSAVDPVPVRGMNDLVRMNRCDLEALYRGAEIGCPPKGVVNGRAIINPGSKMTVPTSRVVHLMWQGKVVSDDVMVNRVFGGFRAVQARVFVGDSWLDGKPTLVMDYAGSSKLFGEYRDEVREIAPGLYLGLTYKRAEPAPEIKAFFTLEPRKK